MNQARNRKIFVFVLFMVMLTYESIPDKPYPPTHAPGFYDAFPVLDDHTVTWQTYVYCLGIQIAFMGFARMLWELDRENTLFMRGLFFITVFYLIEYVLHYSSTWYRTEHFDFSSHIFTSLYLGYLLFRDE